MAAEAAESSVALATEARDFAHISVNQEAENSGQEQSQSITLQSHHRLHVVKIPHSKTVPPAGTKVLTHGPAGDT